MVSGNLAYLAIGSVVIVAIAAIGFVPVAGQREASADLAEAPYADEYPAIGYATSGPGGRLGRFAAAVEDGSAGLSYLDQRGYLDSVLRELEIDPSSQVLVFSRTSLQVSNIHPETPRAIYFNDDSYVAWIPGARALEISSYDPFLGPIFYTLLQDRAAELFAERQLGVCLRCHDTYGLSGGGVPRFLLGSGYTGTEGELVSHEAWILTSQATPLRNRWGGWYVSGQHGDAVHLGNIVVKQTEDLQDLEALRVGNVDEVSEFFDTSDYLTPLSDIVALLVLEHQVEVQNLISRLRFESAGRASTDGAEPLDRHVEQLVRAMLMVDEIELTAPIEGDSAFAEHFESIGPFDSMGRSLREFDLRSRLFRYPLSYLLYSDAFDALPVSARRAVFERLRDVLESTPEEDGITRLSVTDRMSIVEILTETHPDVLGL